MRAGRCSTTSTGSSGRTNSARCSGVPKSMLPEVKASSGRFGVTDPSAFHGLRVPVSGIAGDQQSALFGQGCYHPGRSKNTYGTGSFLLLNAGETVPPVREGLLSTVAWTVDGHTDYALEGAIFVTGATLQWMRDGLQLISNYSEAEPLASSVPDTDGVFLVPAFTGLGSPYWDPTHAERSSASRAGRRKRTSSAPRSKRWRINRRT